MLHYCFLYGNLHLILIEARWIEVSCILNADGETIVKMVAPYSGRA